MIVQIMQKELKTISEGFSITQAAEKMQKEGIGSLLVERKGIPVGIITDTAIVHKAVGLKKNLDETKVENLMTSPLPTIQLAQTSHDALDLMGDLGVRHLVVCDGPKIVGLISARDLLVYFGSVSEPRIGVD
ncbi:CBS domain-containing protein [Candidatus Nitrospira allomarina]|jgi:signal-transduction protein with cAMP-binding, CBS, and nucleotidyltransferase domain|uniref:CBS domain-containing protein n=1 Tax=Candidatus Nitrospira allomarina TaxID=3020900 RepID=A0AA96JXN1_9BACT|nr:CBS domain-containing protein [Candidatus Nitrospira allomarina]WNM59206.1 CBS domain-containing protein [Candidatus Nitrospira allomarina]